MAPGQDAMDGYGDALAGFETRDGWSADARAAKALAGPGLGDVPLDRPVATLSEGQHARPALAPARLLTSDPHVLLLDEPTNHLSLSLVEEREDAVVSSPLAVVLVSHDRWFRRRWTGDHLVLAPA